LEDNTVLYFVAIVYLVELGSLV